MARGLGAFAMGVGSGRLSTAQANSINADTVMRWNQANWEAQHALNISYYYRRMRRRERNIQVQSDIYDRLRNHPNETDIENGDALNVAFDEVTNPKYGSAVRRVSAPLSNKLIRDIPFEHASEAVTICLDELTAQTGWPPALREESFAPYRKDLQDTIKEALIEDEKDELTPATIKKVEDAVNRLSEKFEATVPQSSPDYIPAKNHIKTLYATARMLHSPQVETILAGLEKYPGTTMGDLLMFMHAYNLRFAPAKNVRQREIYQQIFPVLDQVRDGIVGDKPVDEALAAANDAATKANNALSGAASSFFKDMGWEHATGKEKTK
jgi:hypothetical protein